MTIAFISDLHLDESRPQVTDLFIEYLRVGARSFDAIYILGDLFEVWLGDDDDSPHHRRVVAALREYTAAGRDCYFVWGNRDILIGRQFCRDAGVKMLEEQTVAEFFGQRTLLVHGDELCTDDAAYQRFRRRSRNRLVQWVFLRLPLAFRQSLANRMRSRSKQHTARVAETITDVNQGEVENTMRRHGVSLLIHGHTHRPGMHDFDMDGKPMRRIVLGDWYEQGSALEWSAAGYELRAMPFSSGAQSSKASTV